MLRHALALGAFAAMVLGCLAPSMAAPLPACAAVIDHAALVVDTGARATRYCVAMDHATVSGLDLIELASDQYGLDYALGYGGKAVCRLDGTGTNGGECLAAGPDFWGYWRGDGSGGWTWSSTGAADTLVEPGGAEGWSWGSGTDGSSHPQPPPTTASSVCGIPAPGPGPSGGGGNGGQHAGDAPGSGGAGGASILPNGAADATGSGHDATSGGGSGGSAATRASPQDGSSRREGNRGHTRPGATTPTAPPPEPSPTPIDAMPLASGAPPDGPGPPLAALASAAAAIVLLLAAGWLSLRRRAGTR